MVPYFDLSVRLRVFSAEESFIEIKTAFSYHFCIFCVDCAASLVNMRYYIALTLFLIVCILNAFTTNAQLLQGTGSWRDHLPYNRTVAVCKAHSIVFCATPYSIFAYDTKNESITRISKANYLSDVGITSMVYDQNSDKVIVGYENGNIDLITSGSGINMPDIRLSNILGNKAIYDIFPYGDYAYLSTGFGVVVIDLKNLEVRDTYFIGPNGTSVQVKDLVIANNKIYAATNNGLLTADINNPFLANFENWSLEPNLPNDTPPHQVLFFDNHLVLAIAEENQDLVWIKEIPGGDWVSGFSDTYYRVKKLWTDGYWMTISGNFSMQVLQEDFDFAYNMGQVAGKGVNANACIVDEYAQVWGADEHNGLLLRAYFDESAQRSFYPGGPRVADSRRITAYNNNVWIAHGGVHPYWSNLWNDAGISAFVNEQWKGIPADTANNFSGANNVYDKVYDFMQAAIDPNDNNRVFMASFEDGLIEVNGTTMKGRTRNAPGGVGGGPKRPTASTDDWVGVAGVTFDKDGVLWCTNSLTPEGIHALDKNGTFYDYNFAQVIGNNSHISDIIVGSNGYVYAIVIGKGLLVFNHNGTLGNYSDDSYKLLTDTEGDGALPSKDVLSIEEDLDREIWIGTAQGLVVIYTPESIFSEENFNAEFIYIEQDGNTQELMKTEAINAIEIDGGNRKWIGTGNSGAFLFSDNGLNQLYHFNERNSSLPANRIYDIAINHSNGEVFFATEKGIMAFFSTATNFDNEMKEVKVFPNPVRPDYEGNITIDGLAYDSNVKITDIQGNIVYETSSEGGRAIWNGKRFDGERPSTGVYLIYVTTKDGSADDVKKITFIR